MVNYVYNTHFVVSAGKFASSQPWSVINAEIYSLSGGAGSVPVIICLGKYQLYYAKRTHIHREQDTDND